MIPIKDVMSLSKGDIDRELIGHVNTVVTLGTQNHEKRRF